MNLIDIVLLAIALGIDCLVVSFSQGLIFKNNRVKNSLNLATTMGVFQGGMPLLGYVGAECFYKQIVPFGHWIVFTIFLILGLKFITEAFEVKKDEVQCIGIKCLIGLGIATSIDALASGVSIRLTQSNLVFCCLMIGIVSFGMSLFGFWVGNYIKHIPSKYLEIFGGVILIVLAIKSVVF